MPLSAGNPISILPKVFTVSIVAILFCGSALVPSYIAVVWPVPPLVPTTRAINTSLPGIVVTPFVVILYFLLAEAMLGFIIHQGKLILALGLADADGESDADGLRDALEDREALVDGESDADGLCEAELELDADPD